MNAISLPCPNPEHSMSSVLALVTGLVKNVPNEEFGVLARWMSEEANRRNEVMRTHLIVGMQVVWVNTTKKLTQGEIIEVGKKNAKVRSQHGGDLFIPLSRLELLERAQARMSSLPPTITPIPMPPLSKPTIKKAKPRPIAPPVKKNAETA